jgi:hypothetical protein
MAEPIVIPYPIQFKDAVQFGSSNTTFPASVIRNSQVASDAAIDASKLLHLVHGGIELFGPSTTIAALSKDVRIGKGIGTIAAVRTFFSVIGTGDRTVSVDLQKSTGGGAFATVLSAPMSITVSSTVRTLITGTISSATYAAGDLFRWVVALGGSTGNYPQGLFADFESYEATT